LFNEFEVVLFSDNSLIKDQIWQNVVELEVALAHEAVKK
jgi:hypothetical protein